MDDRLFRDTMGKFATGITIVSIEYNGEVMGMTVNAFMSVSPQPKLIAVSIDEKASMYNLLNETDTFGISFLSAEQKELSQIFARQMKKDKEIPFTKLGGVPVIKNALAAISCRTVDKVKAGDHLMIIAEVSQLQKNDGDPLLYFNGKYATLKKSNPSSNSTT